MPCAATTALDPDTRPKVAFGGLAAMGEEVALHRGFTFRLGRMSE